MQPDATGRKMERNRMLVERQRTERERQRTERERRTDAKGTRSCQERYFYCTLLVFCFNILETCIKFNLNS